MFSKGCEYGIKAVVYIATQSLEGKRSKIGDVADNSGSPLAFTAKILGTLSKDNIVNSHTGPLGGFYIDSKQMYEINMSDIVRAIDGDSIYNGCGLGLKECNDKEPCPMHYKFVKVRNEMKEMLLSTSIHDLAVGFKSGKTVLKR